ncbi:MAG: peroxiredoxin, partial [Candidatus Bipolaricaulia bacterium]
MVELGESAPVFTLPATDGEEITEVALERELGKETIVLAFFPLAFSPVCTEELCEFRDSLAAFNTVQAKVFGISVDSPFALKAFAQQNKLNFTLLSDFNREACKAYGVLHEELMGLRGVAKRSVFVIGKDGIVRYKWVSDDPGVK